MLQMRVPLQWKGFEINVNIRMIQGPTNVGPCMFSLFSFK